MLTLRQLRSFRTLSETLHFGEAARRLNISQPALSAQIAAMEESFGSLLFERRPSGVTMTPSGEAIVERVRTILTDVDELEGLGTPAGSVLSGRLRLGLIATVAPYLLPTLLARLAREHPTLDISIRESLTRVLVSDVMAGELDCAVVALPVGEDRLQAIALFEDRFHLAIPLAEAGRFQQGRVPLGALAGERLILLEEGHCLREQAMKVCQLVESTRFSGLGATSLSTILRMVAGGLGATLIPDMAVRVEMAAGGIEVLPFQEPAPSRRLVLVHRPSTARRADFEALAGLLRDGREPS
ncbi:MULTISPECIES: hydrogen peroxide-inducible genes activator [unclassified Aureimonas]|uniref:hydrogen peroxide-inducible genes activator n=1 Tax=unclassified Aureimonas TaxID=2615206 RepID=UPI000700D1BE|nr:MULTISPECIES: hydrogen peroxide-inducible genes activator [unclassified Aureimonas]KQT53812.1 transcriptional regulator [Aureimonas sp. Leaf427]KQT71747.1 transcriptional regulator [Aureimonas sp. Leaf460]